MNENRDEMNEIREERKNEPFASDVLSMLKAQLRFMKVLVVVLVVLLAGTNIFHIWQWSQFDTVVVETTDGYANFVGGENTGGIYNGEDQSKAEKERQEQGVQDQNR